jgi:branched-chain amino acid transport system substrate-binding protein
VAIVVVVVLAASGGESDEDVPAVGDIDRGPDTPIVIPADVPIVIGISTALTGSVGERGAEYRDAVITSVNRWKEANGDQIAGHDIEIWSEDDGCTAASQTIVAAERLLALEGLVGVIGPQCSAGAQLVIRTYYPNAGVVTISGSATKTDLTTVQEQRGFFFRTAYRNDLEGTFIGLFLIGLGAESVYLIDDNELFGRDLANAAATLLRDGDVDVMRRSIDQGTVDFSDLAAEIAADNPDFVVFTGFNPEAALLYRQIRDAGYDGLFGAGDAAASVANFVEPVGADAEGVLFSGCQYPLPADFLEDFVDLHGQEPGATFTAQYADAVTVLLDAVKDVAVDDGGTLVIQPTDLRDAVRATDIEDGISGALAFDANGDRVPKPGDSLPDVQAAALEARDSEIYAKLGLIPCQVQDGELVAGGGPGAVEIEIPPVDIDLP